jgi:hypothetical protein
MLVHKIDLKGVAVLKTEDYAGIGSDAHGMETFPAALDGVELEARQIHVFGGEGAVEDGENISSCSTKLARTPFRSPFSNSRFLPRAGNLAAQIQEILTFDSGRLSRYGGPETPCREPSGHHRGIFPN